MDVKRLLAYIYIAFVLGFAVLNVAKIVYLTAAVGISMEPLYEWAGVALVMDRQLYEQLFGGDLTGRTVVFVAYGWVQYVNLVTNQTVYVHFAEPTLVMHRVYRDAGDYLITVGLNNMYWAEVVPRQSVVGVVLWYTGIGTALVLMYFIGVATTLAVLETVKKEEL